MTVVGVLAIGVDEFGGECCAAEDDGDADTSIVEYIQVLFHECRRLHKQTTHGNAIGFMLLISINDRINGLFNAKINDFVAVVGEDNINEIFTNIVNIASHGCD